MYNNKQKGKPWRYTKKSHDKNIKHDLVFDIPGPGKAKLNKQ